VKPERPRQVLVVETQGPTRQSPVRTDSYHEISRARIGRFRRGKRSTPHIRSAVYNTVWFTVE